MTKLSELTGPRRPPGKRGARPDEAASPPETPEASLTSSCRPGAPRRRLAEGPQAGAPSPPPESSPSAPRTLSVEVQSPRSGPGGARIVPVLLCASRALSSDSLVAMVQSDEPETKTYDPEAEKSTLKQSQSDSALEVRNEATRSKGRTRVPTISFASQIIVETLVVPICPKHGQKGMLFQKGTKGSTSKSIEVEFSDLVDWVKESRALGALCTCSQCGLEFGLITKRPPPSRAARPSASPWGCFGCDLEVK